jgi:hypothetical protein
VVKFSVFLLSCHVDGYVIICYVSNYMLTYFSVVFCVNLHFRNQLQVDLT